MNASQQQHAVFALVTRAKTLAVRMNDRRSDGDELVEELRACANAFEVLALDARRLAGRLVEETQESEEREVPRAAE